MSGDTLHQVGDFCSSYEPDQWDDALRRPVVERIYRQRLKELREIYEESNSLADIELLNWLELSPSVLKARLFSLRVLQKYPQELGRQIIGDRFIEFLKLPLDFKKDTPDTK